MKTIVKTIIITSILFSITSCGKNNEVKVLQGKVKRESISIAPKVPGRIKEIRVKEADLVKKGDTLAIIDVPEVEAKILQAEGAVFSANSQYQMALNGATHEQVEQVNAMYSAANEQFEFAKKSLTRIKNMYNDSLISAQQYDEMLAKYNAAQAQLNAAIAKKNEVLGGVRGEKINMALGQLKQAEGALQEAKTAYNERFIIAPEDMSIETVALHVGELALAGYNLFIGYLPNASFFRFTVKESDLQYFKTNSEYTISLPFEKKDIKGKLTSVKPLAAYANKTASYPDYELGESLYELKIVPNNSKETENLFNNYTTILKY